MDQTNLIRLGVFAGALVLFSALEALFPRRERVHNRFRRWLTNMGLVISGSLSLMILGPLIAVSVAAWAALSNWGVFNLLDWPIWLEGLIVFIILDLSIWYQHVLFHKIPILWRLHSVHHADRDLDASSGIRFHPLEFLVSMLYKCGVVVLLGPSVLMVIIFEVVLNATAIYTHANIKLPKKLDRLLRILIVTPDMHRVHHSVIKSESQKNYGFNFSIWDRLFKTYQAGPEKGQVGMILGLGEAQNEGPKALIWSLLLPFKKS